METLKIQQVLCNLTLIIVVLLIWTWSLTQFVLVMTAVSAPKREAVVKTSRARSFFGGCCENEIWAIIITMMMQDAPFLITRLYLIFEYMAISPLIIFFVFKNAITVVLLLYRVVVVCTFKEDDNMSPEEVENGQDRLKQAPLKPDDVELASVVVEAEVKSEEVKKEDVKSEEFKSEEVKSEEVKSEDGIDFKL